MKFASRCNKHDMLEAAHGLHALLDSSAKRFRELLTSGELSGEWQQKGLLFVFGTPEGMDKYAKTDTLCRETFGVGARRFDGEALLELEPALKPGVAAGGWLYDCDSHVRPDRLMTSYRERLLALGVDLRENCRVQGFAEHDGQAHEVLTTEGSVKADAVVVATGALTPRLEAALRCRVPIQPGKGYSMTMPRPAVCPEIPMIFSDHKVAITPMESGYRIGSTMEFAGYDETLNPVRLQALKDGAAHYLREPYTEPVEEQWFGHRPMTYDGLPMIGPTPRIKNVYLAAGHNMLGLSMAAGTGQLIRELILGETPHIDPTPYRVERFQ
jgi:D-amino-acid dehydrogenase